MSKIILVNGAIASGKTTVGRMLSKYLTDQGTPTVFLDLDSEVEKLSPGFEWEHEDLKRHDLALASKILAERTNSAMHLGRDTVIVGPFFTKYDIHDYTKYLEDGYIMYCFHLSASMDVRAKRNLSRPNNESPRREILEQQVLIEQEKHPNGVIVDGNGEPNEALSQITRFIEENKGVYDFEKPLSK